MVLAPSTGLGALLDDLLVRFDVPGAAIAVLEDGGVSSAAAGVVNIRTGVEATSDTLFQIGSITKVYTATLVMQLVDEGLVALDAPVRTYLPEFRLPDEDVAAAVTVRQLLAHTSGMEGDRFLDTGRGDECIARFVEECATLPQIAPPGKMFSYCNAGFVVLGRIVEKLRGVAWDEALRSHLLARLGLASTLTLPEEVLLHRAAVGHVYNAGDGLAVASRCVGNRSGGPAGRIAATAADVLGFAKMHLDGGAGVLSRESVAAMQQAQVELDDPYTLGRWWGLGWEIFDWTGTSVIGHGGTTIGQCASLCVSPAHGFAVCVLTNGWTGGFLCKEVMRRLFSERVGVAVPERPEVRPGVLFDADALAGTYERHGIRFNVEAREGELTLTREIEGDSGASPAVKDVPLRPVDPATFLFRMPVLDQDIPVVFVDFDASGCPRYLHSGGRAARRT